MPLDSATPLDKKVRSRAFYALTAALSCAETSSALRSAHRAGVLTKGRNTAHRRLTWADTSFFLSRPSSSGS